MAASRTAVTAQVAAAYRHCEQITRTQARNFAYGIALLPREKRQALSAVYALARRIDDIGDGTLPADGKLAALAAARSSVQALAAPGGQAPAGDMVLVALGDAAGRFAIPLSAFCDLIEGCEADVRGVTYRSFGELEHYCRCVAGSIGRLSLGVFGTSDLDTASPLADDLGVALQLTNILRDIREDLGNGRVYLPAEDLDRFGCTLGNGDALRDNAALERLVLFEVQRARDWYAIGLRLMPLLDRRSAASAGAMAGIYRRLLDHIAAAPAAALASRMSLPAGEKALVAAKSLAGMVRRPARPAAAPPGSGPQRGSRPPDEPDGQAGPDGRTSGGQQ